MKQSARRRRALESTGGLFPGFVEQAIAADPLADYPKRLRDMHKLYGSASGALCKTCAHFRRYKQGSTWFKCDASRMSNSNATDWRAGWPACGHWEKAKKGD